MYSFIIALFLLILGYFTYGVFVEKVFSINQSAKTPAYKYRDGIDFVPMRRWRIFLIQFLNIAGLGPIFGAIMGMFYGPAAYLWIVFGCIFGGAVHDYLCGMMSLRMDGISLPEVLGEEFGKGARHVIRFMLVLMVMMLILLTTSFLEGVAVLLQDIIPLPSLSGLFGVQRPWVWIILICSYFAVAAILPIDKFIGKIYPFLGVTLLFMGIGVAYVMLSSHPSAIPEVFDGLQNRNPNRLPIFPMMFISISCGAISGFHGTQSPIMARCVTSEHQGRFIFYGAMISEGILALIWAAAAGTFFAVPEKGLYGIDGLQAFAAQHPGENVAALVVNQICTSWLGIVGGFFAVLGVIFAPITSGDTALRSARLMIADAFNLSQKTKAHRLLMTVPLLILIIIFLFVDFDAIWRYFSWFNQTISALALWGGSIFLYRQEHRSINPTRYRFGYLVALIPAVIMTLVSCSYILLAPEGFRFAAKGLYTLSYSISGLFVAFLIWYFYSHVRKLS